MLRSVGRGPTPTQLETQKTKEGASAVERSLVSRPYLSYSTRRRDRSLARAASPHTPVWMQRQMLVACLILLWCVPTCLMAQQFEDVAVVCPPPGGSPTSHVVLPAINSSAVPDGSAVHYELTIDCADAAHLQFIIEPPLCLVANASDGRPPNFLLSVLVHRPIGQLVFAANTTNTTTNTSNSNATTSPTTATPMTSLNVTFLRNASVSVDALLQQQVSPPVSSLWLQLDSAGRQTNGSVIVLLDLPDLKNLWVTVGANAIALVGPGTVFLDFLVQLPSLSVQVDLNCNGGGGDPSPSAFLCSSGCRFILVRPIRTMQQPGQGFGVSIQRPVNITGALSLLNGTSALVDVFAFNSFHSLVLRATGVGPIPPATDGSSCDTLNNRHLLTTELLTIRIAATNSSGAQHPPLLPATAPVAYLVLASSLLSADVAIACVAAIDISSGGALLGAASATATVFNIQYTVVRMTASAVASSVPMAVAWIELDSFQNQWRLAYCNVTVDCSHSTGAAAAAVWAMRGDAIVDEVGLEASRVLLTGGSAYFVSAQEARSLNVRLTLTDVTLRHDAAVFLYGRGLYDSTLSLTGGTNNDPATVSIVHIVRGTFTDYDLTSNVVVTSTGVTIVLDTGERDAALSKSATCVWFQCRGANQGITIALNGVEETASGAANSDAVNLTVAGKAIFFNGPMSNTAISFLGLSVWFSSNLWYERCLVQSNVLMTRSSFLFDGAGAAAGGGGSMRTFALNGNPCLFGRASTVSLFQFAVRNALVAWADEPSSSSSSVSNPSVSIFFVGFVGTLVDVRIDVHRCIGRAQNLRLAWAEFDVGTMSNIAWRVDGGSVLTLYGTLTAMQANHLDASMFTVSGSNTRVTCAGGVRMWSPRQKITGVTALALRDNATIVLSDACVWIADGGVITADSVNVALLNCSSSSSDAQLGGGQLILRNSSRLGEVNSLARGTSVAMRDACTVSLHDVSRLLQVASSGSPAMDFTIALSNRSVLVASTSVVAVMFFSANVAGMRLSITDNAEVRLTNVVLLMAKHVANANVSVARSARLVLHTSLVDRPEAKYVAPPSGLIASQNGNLTNLTVLVTDGVRVEASGAKVWLVSAFATTHPIVVGNAPSVLRSVFVLRDVLWIGPEAASNRLVSAADGTSQSVSVDCTRVTLQVVGRGNSSGLTATAAWIHLGDTSINGTASTTAAAADFMWVPLQRSGGGVVSVAIRFQNCTLTAATTASHWLGSETTAGIVNISGPPPAVGQHGYVYLSVEANWVTGFDAVLVGVTPASHSSHHNKPVVNITSCDSNHWRSAAANARWRFLEPRLDVVGPGPTFEHLVSVVVQSAPQRLPSSSGPPPPQRFCRVTQSASLSGALPTRSEPLASWTASYQAPPPPVALPVPFAAVRAATDAVATTTVAASMVVSSAIPRPAVASSLIQLSASAIACAGGGGRDQETVDAEEDPFSSGVSDNPLQLRISFEWVYNNSSTDDGTTSLRRSGVEFASGTVVGNALVILPAYAALLIGVQWIIAQTRRDHHRRGAGDRRCQDQHNDGDHASCGRLRGLAALAVAAKLPGALVVPFALLLQPTMVASVGLVGRCSQVPSGACALGCVGVVWCLVPCVWFGAMLCWPGQWRGSQRDPIVFRAVYVGGDSDHNDSVDDEEEGSDDDDRRLASRLTTSSPWAQKWQALVEPQWVWREAKLWRSGGQSQGGTGDDGGNRNEEEAAWRHRCFLQGVALVEPYRSGCHWYALLELGTILLSAIPLGVAWALDYSGGGGGACDASLWAVLVITCIAMLFSAVVRPFAIAIENAWAVAMQALTIVVVAALLADGAAAVANGAALAQSVASVLPVLRLLPVAVGKLHRYAKAVVARHHHRQATSRERARGGATTPTTAPNSVATTVAMGGSLQQGASKGPRRSQKNAAASRATLLSQRVAVARLLVRALAESRRSTPPTPQERRQNVALLVQLAIASSALPTEYSQ